VEAVQGWERVRLGILVLLICGQISACSRAIYYQVRRGDTLSEIAQRHRVSVQQIARFNTIRDPDKLEVGQWLRIPPPGKGTTVASTSPEKRGLTSALLKNPALDRPLPEAQGDFRVLSRDRERLGNTALFSWPVEGEVTSGFGPRNGSFHDGIDISAPAGAPVLVAADGQVIFSDELRGYGNVVIVRHTNGYITVYAHNRANLVKEGQTVRRGERIAEVGQSGRASGANLHFEIRKDNLARDPLHYLPQDRQTVLKEPAP
jgi:murein DD-endopeptidase MepM/ murein hydrolase activator NlpD